MEIAGHEYHDLAAESQHNQAAFGGEMSDWRQKVTDNLAAEGIRPSYIEYEGPHLPVIARKSDTQQILSAIAALADGVRSRDAQLANIATSQRINHEFIVQVIGSLEGRMIEMQQSQIRWIELYERKLAAIEEKLERVEAMVRAGRTEQRLQDSLKFKPARRKAKKGS